MLRQDVNEKCQDFARTHLTQCARELVEFESSKVLPNGRIRELIEIIKEVDSFNYMSVARSILADLCIAKVASSRDTFEQGN